MTDNNPSPPPRLWAEIASRLRRAVLNGTRLHLEPEHARAIFASEIYIILTRMHQQEVSASWTDEERRALGLQQNREPGLEENSPPSSAEARAVAEAKDLLAGRRPKRR